MNTKIQANLSGAALALAMASLSGLTMAHETSTAPMAAGQTDLVHCYGVNVCKGHNDCKTADNACGGQASCKGTGFVGMPSKACADVGGTQEDEWEGQVTKVDLVQCYGVNICKGHNDCSGADNACGGMGSCKGTGFVNTTAKSCGDIGGKVS
ncbi:MAG: hypothetical protein ACI9IT_000863 [Glaciecola sp.]|jgi:hypothetical protein|nr:hypothetical protein [uncultured Glaciecola sp.]